MSSLTEDVGFLLSRASGTVVRATNAALADHGLRVRSYSVLALAADADDGLSQRALADVLGLDPSQVVQLVDDLVAAGLVERRPSPQDRRAKLVSATPAGRAARRAAADVVDVAVQRCLQALTAQERALLAALLARVG